MRTRLWALTGGIASGKSLVRQMLCQLGAQSLGADDLLRSLYLPGSEIFARIREEFGDLVFTPEGELDRGYLAKIIFADAAARQQLNALVHPLIQAEAQRRFAEHFAADSPLVYEIPLLVETAADKGQYEKIITVTAPIQQRIARIMQRDQISRWQAMQRIYSQASDRERAAAADWVIDNSTDETFLRQQVESLWRSEC